MNKIKNLFKASPIAMAVAGLAILVTVGVVSAAIVSYISNAPTATVTVSSPVEMSICKALGGDCGASITLTPTTGGSTFTFTTTAQNNANNRIGGYYVTVIDAGSGDKMTGKEFTKIDYTINEPGYIGEDGELIVLDKLCVVNVDDAGALTLTKLASITDWSKQKMILFYDYDALDPNDGSKAPCSELTLSPWGDSTETRSFTHLNAAGTTMSTRVRTFTPTWDTGVLGEYKISAQYVNDLAKYAAETY